MAKSLKHRLIFVGVGILLILLGARGVALRVAGKSTQAIVTGVKRATDGQNDMMDHNYRIGYRFAVNGKDFSGSLMRKKVYNTATLPSTGGTVAIRYLPSVPSINGGSNEGLLTGLVLGVLGIGVFIMAIRPAKAVPQEAPQGDARADAKS